MEKLKQNERQRNWFQLKEQEKATENQKKKKKATNEIEITHSPGKEFRELFNRAFPGGSVMKICLPMQGTQVRSLTWEDPTC